VETILLILFSVVLAQLQWGHVFSDVETVQEHDEIVYTFLASMGPRLFRRGNADFY